MRDVVFNRTRFPLKEPEPDKVRRRFRSSDKIRGLEEGSESTPLKRSRSVEEAGGSGSSTAPPNFSLTPHLTLHDPSSQRLNYLIRTNVEELVQGDRYFLNKLITFEPDRKIPDDAEHIHITQDDMVVKYTSQGQTHTLEIKKIHPRFFDMIDVAFSRQVQNTCWLQVLLNALSQLKLLSSEVLKHDAHDDDAINAESLNEETVNSLCDILNRVNPSEGKVTPENWKRASFYISEHTQEWLEHYQEVVKLLSGNRAKVQDVGISPMGENEIQLYALVADDNKGRGHMVSQATPMSPLITDPADPPQTSYPGLKTYVKNKKYKLLHTLVLRRAV